MTESEFEELSKTRRRGTTLSFYTGGQKLRGKFIGCTESGVIIEAKGRARVWQKEQIDFKKSSHSAPLNS